jgi:hypothetical protein
MERQRKNNVIDACRRDVARSPAVQPAGPTIIASSTRGSAMMTFSSRIAIAAAATLMLAGAASAQTPAPTPTPMTKSAPADTTTPAAKSGKPRTEVSLECSKQADAKGLHGKERKTFRSECKKNGGKAS